MDAPKRYHPALVTLHWLMVVLVFINLYLGIFAFEDRGGQQNFQMMNMLVTLHMVVGLTIIVLLIVRFILRIRTRRPVDATAGNKFLDVLAKAVHYGLYVAVLAVTVLGLIFSLQSGRFQSAFLGARQQFGGPTGGFSPGARQTQIASGTQMAPGNNGGSVQGGPGNAGGPNGQGRRGFPGGGPGGPGGFGLLIIHEWTAYLLLFLVVLHIGAALYHQFIRKDNLIARMWYGPR